MKKKFLGLNETAWMALSTIITLIGVLTALFLPFYVKHQENENIKILINTELVKNCETIREAKTFLNPEKFNVAKESINDALQIEITPLDLISARLESLSSNIWDEYGNHLATYDSKLYLTYLEKYETIDEIRFYNLELKNNNTDPRISTHMIKIGIENFNCINID